MLSFNKETVRRGGTLEGVDMQKGDLKPAGDSPGRMSRDANEIIWAMT